MRSLQVLALTICIFGTEASALTTQIGLNFTGTTRLDRDPFVPAFGELPPDTMGAVGDGHIVELLNGRYAVYRKSDGALVQSDTLNGFWTSAGVAPADGFPFDPRILYDGASQRWFAVSTEGLAGPTDVLVAVSQSSNPTQGWSAFRIESDSTQSSFADFPTLGLDAEAVYVATTQFPPVGGGAALGATVAVLPKSDLVASSPSVSRATVFENQSLSVVGPQSQPVVDFDGSGLPAGLWSGGLSAAGFIQGAMLTGPVDAPTLGAGPFVPVPAVMPAGDAAQPSPANDLYTGDQRFGSSVVLRNGSLWAVQHVDNGGRVAIRWYEIDASTNILLQSGLVEDPDLDLFYPSIAVNAFDEVVIGFTGSGESQFASAYAVVGEASGGVTTFDTPILLKQGVSTSEIAGFLGRNVWGDYSATVVDPSDPRVFWTFQEFVSATDVWGIQITQIIVPEPDVGLLLAAGLFVSAAMRRRSGQGAVA